MSIGRTDPGGGLRTLRTGAGAPGNGFGFDGDYYINTLNDSIYGPKTGGVWGAPTSLVGANGADGAAANQELGYAEITSNVNGASSFLSPVDVPGLSVTVTVGARPIKVIFDCPRVFNTGGGCVIYLAVDAGSYSSLVNFAGSAISGPVNRQVRLNLSAGSHSFKIGASLSFGNFGTWNFEAAAPYEPTFLQVVEC